MKKIVYSVLFLAALTLLPFGSLWAANGSAEGQNRTGQSQTGNPGTGNMNQNQNQNRLQNGNGNGNGNMNQEKNRERVQEEIRNNEQNYSPQNGKITGRAQAVRNAVENLIQLSYQVENEGLASQIRTVAEAQVRSEDVVNDSLDKAFSRTAIAKFFIGPNYQELVKVKQELEQNRLRITELQRIQAQIQNEGLETELQNQITLLEEQNTALQNLLNDAASGFSLLGWLFRWINQY